MLVFNVSSLTHSISSASLGHRNLMQTLLYRRIPHVTFFTVLVLYAWTRGVDVLEISWLLVYIDLKMPLKLQYTSVDSTSISSYHNRCTFDQSDLKRKQTLIIYQNNFQLPNNSKDGICRKDGGVRFHCRRR